MTITKTIYAINHIRYLRGERNMTNKTNNTLWCISCFKCNDNGTRKCTLDSCTIYRYFSGIDDEEWVEIPLTEVRT